MKIHPHNVKTALVLPGGGARGAYQVGVLKAVAHMVPHGCHNPFPILSGTSAGAINSVVLASRARDYRQAVAELEHVWAHFRSAHVFRDDSWTMFKSSMHWLGAIVTGGTLVSTPRCLLDNAPLRALLSRNIRFPLIEQAIGKGDLHAVAVTAAGYGSARSTSFFEAVEAAPEWTRKRRIGRRSRIGLDHLMASIAVPMVFSPVRIGGEYFGDGAMRQATPLSPAIHLGADRILVVGVRDETADPSPDPSAPQAFPSFAHIAGYMLDTLFMDGLYSDLERMTRFNQLIDATPESQRGGALSHVRAIDTMVVLPSKDLREIAWRHRSRMPATLRTLLRGISGRASGENRLLSFLLFEQAYTRELIQLGFDDAMAQRDALLAFITGASVERLTAPSWVLDDLSRFDDR